MMNNWILRVIIDSIKLTRRIMKADAIKDIIQSEHKPGDSYQSDE